MKIVSITSPERMGDYRRFVVTVADGDIQVVKWFEYGGVREKLSHFGWRDDIAYMLVRHLKEVARDIRLERGLSIDTAAVMPMVDECIDDAKRMLDEVLS